MNSLPPNISKLIGQMIMVGIKGHDRDAVYDFFERNYKYHVGGIILYDEDITTNPPSLHNIRSQQQLSNFTNYLQEFSSNPLLIGIDQEGGKVNRLKEIYGFPKTISWSKLGNINDLKKTELESNNIAKSLNRCGINVNFSPVLDLDISKNNIISQKDRAISSDYKVVFEHAQTSIKCHLDHDIIAVGKHFPGHGDTSVDSHVGLPVIEANRARLDTLELLPFAQVGVGGLEHGPRRLLTPLLPPQAPPLPRVHLGAVRDPVLRVHAGLLLLLLAVEPHPRRRRVAHALAHASAPDPAVRGLRGVRHRARADRSVEEVRADAQEIRD